MQSINSVTEKEEIQQKDEINVVNPIPSINLPTFFCDPCNRNFIDCESLSQHERAKHGLYPQLLPEWALASTTLNNTAIDITNIDMKKYSDERMEIIPCEVCDMKFKSEDELQHHLERGFLPTNNSDSSFTCDRCARVFNDNRSLWQHYNFCLI